MLDMGREREMPIKSKEASPQGNGTLSRVGPARKAPGWTRVLSRDQRDQACQLTYEWLHRAVNVLVLFEARGGGEGLAAVGAGVGPGANVL